MTWLGLTELSSTFHLWIINKNGMTVNELYDTSLGFETFIPNFTTKVKPLTKSINTNNNRCGITGKARIWGEGALKVIQNPTGLTTIFSGPDDQSGADKTLPDCEPPSDTTATEVSCANTQLQEIEGDGEQPTDPACSGGPGGHDANQQVCEPWARIISVSFDGGQTWTVLRVEYFDKCSG